jgi:ribosomal protein S18 acetylase RimI-like enzyme
MEIREESQSFLEEYARVSIAVEVNHSFELSVLDEGLAGFSLAERPLKPTIVKDYDAIPGNHPRDWQKQFDLTNWGLLSARWDGEHVGGAVIALKTPGLLMLEGRSDLSVLWDIRVAPQARGSGVGAALFRAAERWAGARSCRLLKVETQNDNVPACRFYASLGCTLGGINRFAYPALPEEIQLLWYKRLGDAQAAA